MFANLIAPSKSQPLHPNGDLYSNSLCKSNNVEIINAFQVADCQWPDKHLADHTLEILLSAVIGELLFNNRVTSFEEQGLRKLLKLLADKGIKR